MNQIKTWQQRQAETGIGSVEAKDDEIRELRQAIEQAEEVEPLTNSYVQHVPDKCDRIIWRNQYIHLPPTAPAQQPVKVAQTFHSNGKPKGYVLLKQPQRTGE